MEGTVEERVLDIQQEKRELVTKAFKEKNARQKKTKETRMADVLSCSLKGERVELAFGGRVIQNDAGCRQIEVGLVCKNTCYYIIKCY